MRRACRDRHGGLADLDGPNAVRDGDSGEMPALRGGVADFLLSSVLEEEREKEEVEFFKALDLDLAKKTLVQTKLNSSSPPSPARPSARTPRIRA